MAICIIGSRDTAVSQGSNRNKTYDECRQHGTKSAAVHDQEDSGKTCLVQLFYERLP